MNDRTVRSNDLNSFNFEGYVICIIFGYSYNRSALLLVLRKYIVCQYSHVFPTFEFNIIGIRPIKMFKVVRASRTLAKIGDLAPSVSSGQHNFTLFKIQKSNICVQNIVKFPKPCCFSSDSAAPSENGPNIFAITKGDQELEHKLKVLILEVDVMRQDGHLVPDEKFMQDNHWVELLNCPTISSRRRYLEFLFKLSKKKENRAVCIITIIYL